MTYYAFLLHHKIVILAISLAIVRTLCCRTTPSLAWSYLVNNQQSSPQHDWNEHLCLGADGSFYHGVLLFASSRCDNWSSNRCIRNVIFDITAGYLRWIIVKLRSVLQTQVFLFRVINCVAIEQFDPQATENFPIYLMYFCLHHRLFSISISPPGTLQTGFYCKEDKILFIEILNLNIIFTACCTQVLDQHCCECTACMSSF